MIPYDIDPSLHTAEPEPAQLDDGFSPRHQEETGEEVAAPHAPGESADAIGEKSPF
jgi:hypothetical protein